ncbi:MAG: flagellar biosynthesis protein FlhF [Planctomycetes bacterium]|nr:flagellar biosynthesis protein FlhF [Planctomycetota bacterium]
MKLKTFSGRTMAEALDQVKRQFGRHAVILTTRTLTRGGFFGLGGSPYVEITAAREIADLPEGMRGGSLMRKSGRSDGAEGAAVLVSPPMPRAAASQPDAVLAELGAVKNALADLLRESRRARSGSLPEALYAAYEQLVQAEIADQLAAELVQEVRSTLPPELITDRQAVRARLAALLEAMVPTAGPIPSRREEGPTVVALVGPTGVGKTTTVAKLAANFALRERSKVGLITVDTYRIAAVEQLRTYAEIIDVPLVVAATPGEYADALRTLADRDVVLIDTAGRSQRDGMKIEQLRGFFDVGRPHQVHLVLSTTSGEAVIAQTTERFRPLGIDRVILTKLDEAVGFGALLTCMNAVQAKLSYVTTGQDVPDDIEVGRSEKLARLILGERAT